MARDFFNGGERAGRLRAALDIACRGKQRPLR